VERAMGRLNADSGMKQNNKPLQRHRDYISQATRKPKKRIVRKEKTNKNIKQIEIDKL